MLALLFLQRRQHVNFQSTQYIASLGDWNAVEAKLQLTDEKTFFPIGNEYENLDLTKYREQRVQIAFR